VSIIAAFISYLLQRHSDRRRHRERAAFQVYMLLLNLHGHYFWIASNEIRGEPPPPEMTSKSCGLALQIADKLREADDIPHLQEILTVLMSEDAYKTANDRARALNAVIDSLGETVNPRYAKIVQGISDDNVRGFMDRPSGHRNNAPALMDR
jgi:hypothetical protein